MKENIFLDLILAKISNPFVSHEIRMEGFPISVWANRKPNKDRVKQFTAIEDRCFVNIHFPRKIYLYSDVAPIRCVNGAAGEATMPDDWSASSVLQSSLHIYVVVLHH